MVTGTGKKLELGLSFSYVGLEGKGPGSSGLGEPNGGGPGESSRRGQEGVKYRGVRDGGGSADGPEGGRQPSRQGAALLVQVEGICESRKDLFPFEKSR